MVPSKESHRIVLFAARRIFLEAMI